MIYKAKLLNTFLQFYMRVCLSSCMFIYTHGNYDLNVGTVLKHSHISRVKNPKHLHSVIYCTQVMYIV